MSPPAGAARNKAGVATAVGILAQRFGPRVETGGAIRDQHRHSTSWIAGQTPDAVVYPQNAQEVQEIVRICADHRAPVIGFGAGTSLEGQVNAPLGGISVDFAQMNRVLAVNAADQDCRVEPGITHRRLNVELRDVGLFFPVDPGADASIGGMAATRASGTNAVRYGTMRDAVLAVEAVLPSGELLTSARRARKSAAGYDLTRLMIGSEGTLGLITALTLRLQGIPEEIAVASCSFPSVEAACNCVIATVQMQIPVARMELLDALSVQAINRHSKLSLPETPLLLMEFHGSPAGVAEQAQRAADLAAENGGSGFDWATEREARTRLWRARHDAYWALRDLRPQAEPLTTDVCVPVSRLAECVKAAQDRAAADGLTAPILGHAGDGNFHVQLLIDGTDEAERARAAAYVSWLAELAIGMDGTCTGEHGIGQGKVGYLETELGAAAVHLMAAIKAAIDPLGIMNPGKILPRV